MSLAVDSTLRGATQADEREFALAAVSFEAALKAYPSFVGYCNLGEVYEVAGDTDKAIVAYRQASELEPTNPTPFKALGYLYLDKKDYAKAQRQLERALALYGQLGRKDPELLAAIHGNMGNVYFEQFETATDPAERRTFAQQALAEYEITQAILSGGFEEKRLCAVLLHNLGKTYTYLGSLDKAESTFNRCIALKRKLGADISLAISLHNIKWGQTLIID
jgi:tetratricopeptide (TPR) repeat protein